VSTTSTYADLAVVRPGGFAAWELVSALRPDIGIYVTADIRLVLLCIQRTVRSDSGYVIVTGVWVLFRRRFRRWRIFTG
jgi:hypothetical protein